MPQVLPTDARFTFRALMPAADSLLVAEVCSGCAHLRDRGFVIDAVNLQGSDVTIAARIRREAVEVLDVSCVARELEDALGARVCRVITPIPAQARRLPHNRAAV